MTSGNSDNRATSSDHQQFGDEYKLIWLGQLTASVIHELRNPLTVLSLSLSSIEQDAKKIPEMKEALHSAQISVERMTKIMNSTLDFLRSESTEMKPLDLRALVKETIPL